VPNPARVGEYSGEDSTHSEEKGQGEGEGKGEGEGEGEGEGLSDGMTWRRDSKVNKKIIRKQKLNINVSH
jgi:hypothetical protein